MERPLHRVDTEGTRLLQRLRDADLETLWLMVLGGGADIPIQEFVFVEFDIVIDPLERNSPPSEPCSGVDMFKVNSTWWIPAVFVLASIVVGCQQADLQRGGSQKIDIEDLAGGLGGGATVFSSSRSAFGLPAPSLDPSLRPVFERGDDLFSGVWSPRGVGPVGRDGLGPLFAADSCAGCHVRDGRSQPLGSDDDFGIVVVLDSDAPMVGTHVQLQSSSGFEAEGVLRVDYVEVPGAFGDGETYSLREPVYSVVLSDGSRLDRDRFSVRTAPPVFGSGLLEAVPVDVLEDIADPGDDDRDGVSGVVNMVVDPETGELVLGRFGWKAAKVSIRHQTAQAAAQDLGLTSSLFAEGNCAELQVACVDTEAGVRELSDTQLGDLVAYVSSLGVPAMRNTDDPAVVEGAGLFVDIGCAACHRPTLATGEHPIEALADQVIHPFTDLLVHDMGDGLADMVSEGQASGAEWRTAPLWGIGLTATVNGHTSFLHDGRARSLTEAILWHGGEAEAARERFRALTRGQRAALLRFLDSL
ncbi:MAG TPA: di-heme oxidoredictase family protein [Acidimicrobiia bacterium]|nr:di-heme oxidoredictase family protein [Acidimicrobiia bacterium]